MTFPPIPRAHRTSIDGTRGHGYSPLLTGHLLHQGTHYRATAPSVPYLVDAAVSPRIVDLLDGTTTLDGVAMGRSPIGDRLTSWRAGQCERDGVQLEELVSATVAVEFRAGDETSWHGRQRREVTFECSGELRFGPGVYTCHKTRRQPWLHSRRSPS
jgi:hypothetical protein